MLLTTRKLLRDKLQDMENELRGTLRNFGLKVGVVSPGRFEARIRELVAGHLRLEMIVTPLLAVRRVLREQLAKLHKMVLDQVRGDKLCRRLMTVPGVGPVVALTFRATVDQAQRFARSKTVGAHFGLAPRRFQSGEMDYDGRVSKCGDAMMRTALYEAAQVLLTRTQKWSWLKTWGMQVARRRGAKAAPRRQSSPWRDASPWSCTACGWTVRNSVGARRLTPQRHNAEPRVPLRQKSTPRGDDGRGEFAGNAVPLRQDAFQIVPPLLLTPSCGGPSADLGEKREPRETVSDNWRKANER